MREKLPADDVLEHEMQRRFVLRRPQKVHDERMRRVAKDLRLRAHVLHLSRAYHLGLGQHLDRDERARGLVLRERHAPERSGAEDAADVEPVERARVRRKLRSIRRRRRRRAQLCFSAAAVPRRAVVGRGGRERRRARVVARVFGVARRRLRRRFRARVLLLGGREGRRARVRVGSTLRNETSVRRAERSRGGCSFPSRRSRRETRARSHLARGPAAGLPRRERRRLRRGKQRLEHPFSVVRYREQARRARGARRAKVASRARDHPRERPAGRTDSDPSAGARSPRRGRPRRPRRRDGARRRDGGRRRDRDGRAFFARAA
mmetsp:Transcript_4802/g.17152  ORF Transcript_4802/g.17152 Transcript_4802/m.17152 type:complete len:320 (-) Transcript_4802:406-1365(-)